MSFDKCFRCQNDTLKKNLQVHARFGNLHDRKLYFKKAAYIFNSRMLLKIAMNIYRGSQILIFVCLLSN